MNYNSIIKSFICEAKSGIQYKRMGKPFSIFSFIAMLPMIIAATAQVIAYYVLLFVYNGLASSVEYLERWLEGKRGGVRHATEAVLYLVAMPYIFFCQALLAFFAIVFYFCWFALMCCAYVATLGGVKWQPFLNTASFDDYNSRATTNVIAAKVYSIISFSLFVFVVLFNIISLSGGDVGGVASAFSSIYYSHLIIATIAIFRKKIVADGECEAVSAGASDCENAIEPEEEEEDDSLPEL